MKPESAQLGDAASAAAAIAEFEHFVRVADRRLRAVVYRMVADDVDDVMQVAYLRAFRGWSRFRGRSTPTTWLYSIAVRAALDHLRTARRSAASIARFGVVAPGEDPAAIASESIDLARALERLPIDQRVVLLLVDGQGFSHDDTATALNVPVGTVGSRLSRGRKAMRTALGRDTP